MPDAVRVHLLPALVPPGALEDGAVIVIDQLRASTTICAALAAGAQAIVPFLEPHQALESQSLLGRDRCLTGGERGGVLIPGFDLANSPGQYTAPRVSGKTIAFTTTNGTRTIEACGRQYPYIGCLANLSALGDHIVKHDRPIHIVCAGTRNRITLDDVLAAGAFAIALADRGRPLSLPDTKDDDDSALAAAALWRDANSRPGGVLEALLSSRGGRNLVTLGLREDVVYCSRVDALPVVPYFHPAEGQIVLVQTDR